MRVGNLAGYILNRTDSFDKNEAFIVKDHGARQVVSFRAFNRTVRKLSLWLQNQYQPGFRIAIWSENRAEWAALAYAIWHAGGTLIPLMHIATPTEVAPILSSAAANALIVSPRLSAHLNLMPPIKNIYCLPARHNEEKIPTNLFSTIPVSWFDDNPEDDSVRPRDVDDHSLAVLIFTSGTTGRPKGVMLSHENIKTNVDDVIDLIPVSSQFRAVSLLPMSHMFELVCGFTLCHLKGICITYPDSLKPDDVLREMALHRCSILVSVPLFFEIIDRTIKEKMDQLPAVARSLMNSLGHVVERVPALGRFFFWPIHRVLGGHVRYFVSGGAKIDPAVILRFKRLGIRMLQGYGLTETSPIISFTPADDHIAGSVGKPLKSMELRIDNSGEILVRGPSVFMGYEGHPEATRAVIDDERWFHTGDIGELRDGHLFITGRKKDVIVTPNGKNVYPEEIEEALKNSSLFEEIAVIGFEHNGSETVHAVIVPRPSIPLGQAHEILRAEVRQRLSNLADYKQVQGITVVIGELPKTPTKKIKKHLLKDHLAQGLLKVLPEGGFSASGQIERTPIDPTEDTQVWLSRKIKEISKVNEFWLEARLREELRIDSLSFMEMISRIENHFHIQVPDEKFDRIFTFKDMLSVIPECQALSQSLEAQTPSSDKKAFDYQKNNRWWMKSLRWLLHVFILRPGMKLFFRLRIHGFPQIWPQGPLVMAPNHSSHLDLLSVLCSVPLSQINRIYGVAADDYFFDKWWKALFVRIAFNAVPFERRARIERSFAVCERILNAGESLIIFPEGTRSPSGGLQDFKPGVGRLLAGRSISAMPVYISGAHQAFPKGAHLPRATPIKVLFGKQMLFTDLAEAPESYSSVAQKLHGEIKQLAQSGYLR